MNTGMEPGPGYVSPRVCHCTGYLTNPEGKCCMDLDYGTGHVVTVPVTASEPLSVGKIEFDRTDELIKRIEKLEEMVRELVKSLNGD